MSTESRAAVFDFAQKVQTLGIVLLDADPLQRFPSVWDVLEEVPRCDGDDDRAVLAVIVGRVAQAFIQAEQPRELSVTARMRRTTVRHIHCARALQHIQREFANSALRLEVVAAKCHVSGPYLSNVLSTNTHHSFGTHVRGVRVLHAAHWLVTTPLMVEEIADKAGFKNTAALDREFKRRIGMTPGEFRRWASRV